MSSAFINLPTLSPSWFHAKVCVVAGVGFFTDAYVPYPLYVSTASYDISPDMTSLQSTLLPPCWVICTVLHFQVHSSALHNLLASKSQPLLETSLVN